MVFLSACFPPFCPKLQPYLTNRMREANPSEGKEQKSAQLLDSAHKMSSSPNYMVQVRLDEVHLTFVLPAQLVSDLSH